MCLNVSHTLPPHPTAAAGDRQILQMFLLMDHKTNGNLKGEAAPKGGGRWWGWGVGALSLGDN